MIVSFQHKGLQALHQDDSGKGVQAAHAAKLRRILGALDVAASPEDLTLCSFRLHALKGKHQGPGPSGSTATGA